MSTITCIRKIPFEQIWAYSLLEQVKHNREVYWPTRDARTNSETHVITCNKIDFVERTILDNPFPTTRFAWIDSCLDPKIAKICEDYSHSKMLHLLHNINDKFHIQILNVCDKRFKDPEHKREYYNQYRWVVCGGFFTCGAEIGLKVMKRVKEITVETTRAGFGHGEEMFYLEILDEFYDDIEHSYGDYGQIINNFIQPEKNLHYILNCIIRNYANHYHYYRECYDCCKKVLHAIESFTIKEDYYLWTEVYYYYFFSALYIDREEAIQIVERIYTICETNPYFKRDFDNRRDFYESQFALLYQPS
jgi:hypothetical protein